MRHAFRISLGVVAIALLAACAQQPPPPAALTPAPPATPVAPIGPTAASSTAGPHTPAALVPPAPAEALAALAGTITIDGSSTVFPITEAAAAEFHAMAPGVTITLGVSGTGGGFARFCAGEIVIADASRPIKADEIAACAEAGAAFVELPVAYDGIAVVVNAENKWAECLTVAELRRIWEPGATGKVRSWRDVRPDWPDVPLALYGAGPDSGTFDYFTAAVVGEEDVIRADYTASEDDYLLAQDVSANPGGLAFFGYGYSVEYAGTLRAVAVDSGSGCVAPSVETIASGDYQPLARPVFIYVRADALDRPEVASFVRFYLTNAPALVRRACRVVMFLNFQAHGAGSRKRADARLQELAADALMLPLGVNIQPSEHDRIVSYLSHGNEADNHAIACLSNTEEGTGMLDFRY